MKTVATSWTRHRSIDLLNAHPLPTDFRWTHSAGGERPVVPSHSRLRGGYGKWLAEGPQFPGLFELIHDVLADTDSATDTAWLASEVLRAQAATVDSWPQFLTLELSALRETFTAKLPENDIPIAHTLRHLRNRPNSLPYKS